MSVERGARICNSSEFRLHFLQFWWKAGYHHGVRNEGCIVYGVFFLLWTSDGVKVEMAWGKASQRSRIRRFALPLGFGLDCAPGAFFDIPMLVLG